MLCSLLITLIRVRQPGSVSIGVRYVTCWMVWESRQMIFVGSWMFKRFPVYPILFSIYPIVALVGYNIDEIALQVVLRSLLTSLFIFGLLYGVTRLWLRDWHRAAVV